MSIKHEGISRHRLASNPLEALYAEEWEKQAPGTLGYLLCGQEKSQHDYSERDAQVAATIIQWLGSPVGSVFVYDVLEKQKRNEIKARTGKQ
jgi:hypothetical protein